MMNYLKFYNGQLMPMIGMGLSRAGGPNELDTMINAALEIGYRHFDTAYWYQNEAAVGDTLEKWLKSGKIKRQDLFITTKLPAIANYPEKVERFMDLSLKALKLDYVDLYLMHCPVGFTYVRDDLIIPRLPDGKVNINRNNSLEEVWKAMELLVDAGRTKSIGISNLNSEQIERIMKIARIPPANTQNEMNVYLQEPKLLATCQKYNITVVAYAPLGSPGKRQILKDEGIPQVEIPYVLEDPVVAELAEKYGKSKGQILIKFLVQQGVGVIPKSNNPDRMATNIQVFDFEIEESDMGRLKALDRGEDGRIFNWIETNGMTEHPEYPFGRKCRQAKQ